MRNNSTYYKNRIDHDRYDTFSKLVNVIREKRTSGREELSPGQNSPSISQILKRPDKREEIRTFLVGLEDSMMSDERAARELMDRFYVNESSKHDIKRQNENMRAKTVNESLLNEDIFSHPEAWTYKPGDEVRFYMKDVSPEDFGDEEEGELAASHDKMKAIITSQATATATVDELGDKNYEYYDIEFGDGIEIPAVSGYHLELTYSKKRSDH